MPMAKANTAHDHEDALVKDQYRRPKPDNWPSMSSKHQKNLDTKHPKYKPERVVRSLTPGSTVSGLQRVNSALRGTVGHQRDLDHAHADTNMSKRQPRRYRRFFFLVLPPPKKGGGVGWGRAAAAAKIRSRHSSSSSARKGKPDKYRYEVECVTDVPIGCILNR
jgi:hypothetical protein